MGKINKPWYEIILNKMEMLLPGISSSSDSERRLMEFGDILLDSILKKGEKKIVVERLHKIASKYHLGMKKNVSQYLELLAGTLSSVVSEHLKALARSSESTMEKIIAKNVKGKRRFKGGVLSTIDLK